MVEKAPSVGLCVCVSSAWKEELKHHKTSQNFQETLKNTAMK